MLPDGVVAEPERDPELFHRPSTEPGAKLPHAWLVGPHGRRVSTLDLVGDGRWTVLTGLTGTAWRDAAAKVGAELGLDLRAVRIGDPDARDAYGDWSRLSGVAEDGCLLIRPDGYIAHRHPTPSPTPAADLLKALRTLLDRP